MQLHRLRLRLNLVDVFGDLRLLNRHRQSLQDRQRAGGEGKDDGLAEGILQQLRIPLQGHRQGTFHWYKQHHPIHHLAQGTELAGVILLAQQIDVAAHLFEVLGECCVPLGLIIGLQRLHLLAQLQHLLGDRLTHRFLGALEQGFAGTSQHLATQRAELGEQIRAGRERRIPTGQLIQGNGRFF